MSRFVNGIALSVANVSCQDSISSLLASFLHMNCDNYDPEVKEDNGRQKSGWSWPLVVRMIETLQKSVHNFELETCCVLNHNTTIGLSGHPCPTIRGFVVN